MYGRQRGGLLNQTDQSIILVGMMGTGKSTVGDLLASELGYEMIDLDTAIVDKAGLSIPEIFELHGEAYFRQIETAVLDQVLSSGGRQIVATGGGAVLSADNCELMKQGGVVVALTANVEHILERVRGDQNRPLLAGNAEERVRILLKERREAYRFAHYTVDTSGLSAEEVARAILAHYRV